MYLYQVVPVMASCMVAVRADDYANKFMSPQSHGSEAGGNFQGDFTSKYAADYKQYMSTGDEGKGGNLPAFASKFVGDHAGSFEAYMNEPGSKSESNVSSPSEGNYGDYMKEYAGDYQKYMKQGGQSGKESQSGDYQQYMNKYAGDYQKYMKQGAQGKNESQSGDYQQYMKQYAGDYQKYMKQGGDYQKYMKQYAGGGQSQSSNETTGGSSSFDYQKYIDLYSKGGSQGGSSGGDYQKYMKQYAGGQGGSGGYQQYMKKYAGGQGGSSGGDYEQYIKKYAGGQGGSSSVDYQKYMSKNWTKFNQQSDDVVRNARDAKNKTQLDEWKQARLKDVKEFVPDTYGKAASQHVEKQYKERLRELQNATASGASSLQDVAGLDLLEVHDSPVNVSAAKSKHKEEKTVEIARLKRTAEEGVKKVNNLAESLRRSVQNSTAIDLAAQRPYENVKTVVSKSESYVSSNIQLNAVRQAYRQARDASSHAARGTQSQVREEARKVESACDRLARISPADEHRARKWSSQVESDADDSEELGELLARKTENALDQSLSKAQDAIMQQDVMEASQKKETVSRSRSGKFMAQRIEPEQQTASGATFALMIALCTGGVLCYAIKKRSRNSRSLELPSKEYSALLG